MSKNPIDQITLNELLSNNGQHLYIEETDTIEFKSEFDWENRESRANYCKSMAALCNNKGGYLVFGIENETKKILGVQNFNRIDPAIVSDHINNYFSPAIVFQKTSILQGDKIIGILYVERYNDIPTICIKSFDTRLKNGAIFFRYPGKSEIIGGTELIHLLHLLKGRNSKDLVDLKKIEMKQSALPILKSPGGTSQGYRFLVTLLNEGKRAKITSIRVVSGKINFAQPFQFPLMLETDIIINLGFTYQENIPAAQIIYEIELLYEDGIGTKYKITGIGGGPSLKLGEPEEI